MLTEECKFLIPEESTGVITENVKELRKIEGKLRSVFEKNQIIETIVPSFEYVDLYKSTYSNFDEEKVFKYIGKDGKVIALRWDFTIPIARHYFSQKNNSKARYSYFGKIYRKEKTYKGKNSESYQAGIELINHPGIEGNIEILKILKESLDELNLKNIIIEFGSAKLFNRICELVQNKDEFIEYLSKKNISKMEEFINNSDIDNTLKDFFIKLPRLCGGVEILDKYINELNDETIIDSLKELRKTYENSEFKENIIFDLSMYPTMEYYTCLMFKVYSPYSPEPILSGGRYDSLYNNFKTDVPAIGMGYYISNILNAIERENEENG